MIILKNIKLKITGHLEGDNQSCVGTVIKPSVIKKVRTINFVLAFFYAL
jgi:hypothetical protein